MSWKLAELRWRQQIGLQEKLDICQTMFCGTQKDCKYKIPDFRELEVHRRSRTIRSATWQNPTTAGRETINTSSHAASSQDTDHFHTKAAKSRPSRAYSVPLNHCDLDRILHQPFLSLPIDGLEDSCRSLSTVLTSSTSDIARRTPQQPRCFLSETHPPFNSPLNREVGFINQTGTIILDIQ